MIKQPRLRSHLRAEAVGGRVFLLGDMEAFVLEGENVGPLVELLDGTRDVQQLIADLAGRIQPLAVLTQLHRFEAAGYITEGASGLPEPLTEWVDALGLPTQHVERVLNQSRVAVTPLGTTTGTAAAGLRDTGLRNVEEVAGDALASGSWDLVVVLVDDYLNEDLDALNATMLARSQSWMLAKPTGTATWVGPEFEPGETGCWRCLAQRLEGNRQAERFVYGRQHKPSRLFLQSEHASGHHLLIGLLAPAVLTRLVMGRSELTGVLRTNSVRHGSQGDHVLVRQPQCPACGDPSVASPADRKIVLSRGQATKTTDGGIRVCTAQETFDRLQKHISPLIGAVTGVIPLDGGNEDGLTYSYAAGHNFAIGQDSVANLRRNLRSQSGGKGRTSIQAQVSAICEAIERYSAVWRGDEDVYRAAYNDLDSAVAVDPDTLTLYSDAQYEGRDEWNSDSVGHRLHVVPERFDRSREISWYDGWSLTENRPRAVPAAYVWYGHPDLREHFFCLGDSNGSASGNVREEAILQGLCELVERDSVAIWWYNRLTVPGVALDSIDDPYVATLENFYASLDRKLWVLDITSDLGIPAFAACTSRDHDVEDIMVGFGAHPDARTALSRALTEVNQFLPTVRRRDADGNTLYWHDDPALISWCKEAKLADNPWLLPDPAQPLRLIPEGEGDVSRDLGACVQSCVEAAARVGLEVIVADLTRPEIELSVVKVMAPGMRHFWRRTGPGRLYDVPVQMGRRGSPTAESELNPRNVFF
ncbi:TOMM precursor leader peptide-binding protein [Rugosimonospora acidiphila]